MRFFRWCSPYRIPQGYSLRTVTTTYAIRLVPFFGEKQLSEGKIIDIFGYKTCMREMSKICRMHNRHRIDVK